MIAATQIKELRKAKGMTQKELAERAGLSLILIKLLERGRRNGSVETYQAIASATGTTVTISFI